MTTTLVLWMMFATKELVNLVLPSLATMKTNVQMTLVTRIREAACTPIITILAMMVTVVRCTTSAVKEFVSLVVPNCVTIITRVLMILATQKPVLVRTPITNLHVLMATPVQQVMFVMKELV